MNTSLSAAFWKPVFAASTPVLAMNVFSVPMVQIRLLDLLEGMGSLREAFCAQAGECFEHAVMVGKLGVVDHWSSCVDCACIS